MIVKSQSSFFKHHGAAIIAATVLVPSAHAFDIDVGDVNIRFDNLVTVGGLMRLQERDDALVGKSNLQPGLCVAREPDSPTGDPQFSGDTCTTSNATSPGTPSQSNLDFVAAPGAFSSNGDNGNLSFDQGDLVHAAAKLTTDISFGIGDFNVFARSLYFFDALYTDHDILHPDTTLQAATEPFDSKAEDRIGSDFAFLDYFVGYNGRIFDRAISIKVGNHVLNWGESAFLLLNSMNAVNPPDQSRLRIPGFDIKELARPTGMVSFNAQLTDTSDLEFFYQYQWKPVLIDPVGSFFSTSDTVGDGGRYAMLSFGKAPEDPDEIYQPRFNRDDTIGLLGSRSDRTIVRNFEEERAREPSDTGQFGFALRTFLEDFNNGTEIAFYYSRYHSRIPSISAIAADATCINDTPIPNPLCAQTGGEPIPAGSVELVVEYPEGINLYGFSFNTTLGDWALSGEYAYRDNLPIQIHSTDLIFAALQPAFPETAVGPVPGRREAVPDFISVYRNQTIAPNEFIPGYERMKIGQLGMTLLRTVGGDNWVGASQMVILFEAGWLHLFDAPGLDELQFQGAGVDTHITSGADGTLGINPADVRTDPNDPSTNASPATSRQNPTRQDTKGFGDDDSFGYRAVLLTRYDSLFWGVNFELLTAVFHDVHGVSPGLGQNFVEDRLIGLLGFRFNYLANYSAEIRYTYFADDAQLDAQRDRDNLLFFVGYAF